MRSSVLLVACLTLLAFPGLGPAQEEGSSLPVVRRQNSPTWATGILQTALLQQSATKIDVDGQWGEATDKAVRDFQAKRGLAVDGIVGPRHGMPF